MSNSTYQHNVYWLLMQVMFQAKHRVTEIADRHGLTSMQANTLVMLKSDEPLAMSKLSHIFMCDASNVTGIADRLASQGLIERKDHPTDRRIKLIAITEAGVLLRDEIIAETLAAESERIHPVLDALEQQTLRELLNKILDASRTN